MANNFKLTLDTLAPQGSVTRPAEFIKANDNLRITKGDATYMKVWFDTVAQGTKESEGYTSASWEAAATSKMTNFNVDGQYYYHVVLMDNVSNESEVYNTEMITFDASAPEVKNFYLEDTDSKDKDYTNDRTVNYHFEYSDDMSGCASAVISGDALESDINVSDIALNGVANGTLTFKEGTQGSVVVNLVVTDRSGNTSVIATSSIFVDTGVSTLSLLLKTEGGESLPTHINYRNIIAHLKSADTDLVGYKFWEGSSEPVSYESLEVGSALALNLPHTISEGDGTKEFHAKVIDRAGTESEIANASVVYDNTKPVITLECDKKIISNVVDFDKAILTITAKDETAGINNYVVKVGEVSISSGNEVVPSTLEITSANSLVEGSNTITLTVTDKSGNSESKSVSLILDTTSPIVHSPVVEEWYKAEFPIKVEYSDDNKLTTIYAWVNEVAVDQSVPAQITAINVTASGQEIPANQIKFNPIQSDKNYLHIAVVDEVGNIGYSHTKFGFDSEKPTGTIKFDKTIYNGVNASVSLTAFDATSAADLDNMEMNITGDIKNPAGWEKYLSTKTVELTDGDGMKSVEVQLRDKAGNISDLIASSNKCELDTSKPGASIALYKVITVDGEDVASEELKPAVSANAKVAVRINYSDDAIGKVADYKLYGDFEGSSTEWQAITNDEGKDYMTVIVTAIVPTGEEKINRVFNLVVRDEAGNESEQIATASFYLDPTDPKVSYSGLDYNIISKTNVLRHTAEGEVAGKYADQVTFNITELSDIITEWKVCAYKDAEDAKAGSPEDAAIPMTNGSVHMSGETSSKADIDCMIKGADYEAALVARGLVAGDTAEGAHIVVIYVKNEAEKWSAYGNSLELAA